MLRLRRTNVFVFRYRWPKNSGLGEKYQGFWETDPSSRGVSIPPIWLAGFFGQKKKVEFWAIRREIQSCDYVAFLLRRRGFLHRHRENSVIVVNFSRSLPSNTLLSYLSINAEKLSLTLKTTQEGKRVGKLGDKQNRLQEVTFQTQLINYYFFNGQLN